jgi:hypothetical protein
MMRGTASRACSNASTLFRACVQAILAGELIHRDTAVDKEFHFQNWFKSRLVESGLLFETGGRNSYPDFSLVEYTDGFELKGLAYPGREASFDSNSQVPCGVSNGRTIYYVFGRYPRDPDGPDYPVLDLVLCHGTFLNADHEYIHKNRSLKAFGSYGDIMIRDRKMYVVPTPYQLVEGTAHRHSLILPAEVTPGEEFVPVGELNRTEVERLIVGYSFDLRRNEITPEHAPNPSAGVVHAFRAWRLRGAPTGLVRMRSPLEQRAQEEGYDDSAPVE